MDVTIREKLESYENEGYYEKTIHYVSMLKLNAYRSCSRKYPFS
jgi:hypothetical protein